LKRLPLGWFGSEWFGIPIATLALSQVYILLYDHYRIVEFHYAAECFTILGLAIFVFIFTMWVIRGLSSREIKSGGSHWDNLTRMSFISLIPIVLFVGDAQLNVLFPFGAISPELSLIDFYFAYFLSLLLGVLLGYRLYTKEINPGEMNYAMVIPPLAIGTSVFPAKYLITYFDGFNAELIGFLVVMSLGIFFFLYIFIGTLALSGHVSKKVHEALPTTMLPVGIASLIILNLFAISGFGKIDTFSFMLSSHTLGLLSIMLWGFEVWNFLVVLILLLFKPPRGALSVWAYGFPLGLFATSTILVSSVTHFEWIFWVFIIIALLLNILWVYGWLNTRIFVRRMREAHQS